MPYKYPIEVRVQADSRDAHNTHITMGDGLKIDSIVLGYTITGRAGMFTTLELELLPTAGFDVVALLGDSTARRLYELLAPHYGAEKGDEDVAQEEA